MQKKKWIALALAGVLSAGALAGCGDSGAGGNAASVGNGGQTAAATESSGSGGTDAAGATEEVVTLKWIQVGNGMPSNYEAWLEQINPYLEEKIV